MDKQGYQEKLREIQAVIESIIHTSDKIDAEGHKPVFNSKLIIQIETEVLGLKAEMARQAHEVGEIPTSKLLDIYDIDEETLDDWLEDRVD